MGYKIPKVVVIIGLFERILCSIPILNLLYSKKYRVQAVFLDRSRGPMVGYHVDVRKFKRPKDYVIRVGPVASAYFVRVSASGGGSFFETKIFLSQYISEITLRF